MLEIVCDTEWWIFHRDLAWIVTVISVTDSMQAIVTNLLNVQHISIQMVYSLKPYHTNCFCSPSKDEDQSSELLPTE